MTNQTIDGVLISRQLAERLTKAWYETDARNELRALLDAESAPCAKSQVEPSAQPLGEPVADALSTGFYTTETGGGKYAINIGYRSMADMQAADQQLRDLLRARHAEQPEPVAVVLPELEPRVYGNFPEFNLDDKLEDFYAKGWNACLDELKRLNPSL